MTWFIMPVRGTNLQFRGFNRVGDSHVYAIVRVASQHCGHGSRPADLLNTLLCRTNLVNEEKPCLPAAHYNMCSRIEMEWRNIYRKKAFK